MTTRYMFLLYSDESAQADVTPEQWGQMLVAHQSWMASVEAGGGKIEAGDPLAPTTTATTIRKSGGTPVVTDGPFAETKEALGGYYVVSCADLDQALGFAHTCPIDNVEVRPVVEMG
jgi:hypothetical protein